MKIEVFSYPASRAFLLIPAPICGRGLTFPYDGFRGFWFGVAFLKYIIGVKVIL